MTSSDLPNDSTTSDSPSRRSCPPPDTTAASTTSSCNSNNNNNCKSALQDNLERKGKNAYYFAHAHRANGPEWDGKPEPKLLGRRVVGEAQSDSPPVAEGDNEKDSMQQRHLAPNPPSRASAFNYSQSNITSYAFLDDGPRVKLYVDLMLDSSSGIPQFDWSNSTASDFSNKVTLEYTARTLCLAVRPNPAAVSPANHPAPPPRVLKFDQLTANITAATYRVVPSKNRIILTLAKEDGSIIWHTIHDKGTPDHEVV
jgi:hypothetical protein